MKVLLRMFLCAMVGVFVPVAFAGVVQLCGGPALFDRETMEILGSFWQDQQYGDSISRRDAAMQRCLEGKTKIIEALIADEVSFKEAVKQFDELRELLDDGQDEILGVHHSRTEAAVTTEESIRNWVQSTLQSEPSRAKLILERIASETHE